MTDTSSHKRFHPCACALAVPTRVYQAPLCSQGQNGRQGPAGAQVQSRTRLRPRQTVCLNAAKGLSAGTWKTHVERAHLRGLGGRGRLPGGSAETEAQERERESQGEAVQAGAEAGAPGGRSKGEGPWENPRDIGTVVPEPLRNWGFVLTAQGGGVVSAVCHWGQSLGPAGLKHPSVA